MISSIPYYGAQTARRRSLSRLTRRASQPTNPTTELKDLDWLVQAKTKENEQDALYKKAIR